MKTLVEHNRDKRTTFEAVIGEKAGVLCPICKTEMIYSSAGYNKNSRSHYVFCPNADCAKDEEWIYIGMKLD